MRSKGRVRDLKEVLLMKRGNWYVVPNGAQYNGS